MLQAESRKFQDKASDPEARPRLELAAKMREGRSGGQRRRCRCAAELVSASVRLRGRAR